MLFCSLNVQNAVYVLLALVLLFRVVCRWRIFKKMGLRPWLCLIPGIREYQIFKRCWTVLPFIILLALSALLALPVEIGAYVNITVPIPIYIKSNLLVFSIICLMAITIMEYKRLSFAFGRDIGYMVGLLFLNPIFLALLAFSKKNTFHEELTKLRGKELKAYLDRTRTLTSKVLSTIAAMVILCTSVGYIGYIGFYEHQPAYLVKHTINKIYDETSGNVSGRGKVIYPALEDGVIAEDGVRDLYYPDKSGVRETTVYMYLIGSSLEETSGSASVNLAQIIDATKAGSSLRFIVEAGGTSRWFTDGFKHRWTGRYLIQDGKVTLLQTLPKHTSMSEEKTLESFLKWANRKYPSDRRMLFFWDHGGGLSGFGVDILNPRKDVKMLTMDDITQALKASGEQYDLIGFDACLMQTMEVGECLEPYADYLLGSEENEPTTGMYYTAAFSRLAQEPDLSTLKFGAMMCASYDQALEILNRYPQPGYTLSMTELRYIPVVKEVFIGYIQGLDRNFRTDRGSFLNMSTARSKSYEFEMEDQIDLIDFLNMSDISVAQKINMINRIKRAVVVRSAASANHINGLAVYMPYDNLNSYTNVHDTMDRLGMKDETKVYNDFASIIGSQKRTKGSLNTGYYQYEDWYVKGFENYDASLYMQDIPLTKKGGGYEIGLSDKEWPLITKCEKGMKLKVGHRYADLGSAPVYSLDEKGHYKLESDGTWIAIDGIVVALHPGTTRISSDGKKVYTGTVDATLNYIHPISVYIEWIRKSDGSFKGEVLGYLPADADSNDIDETGMPRGFKQFKASNYVIFLYDWYDKEDNYIATALGQLPIRVGADGLKITKKNLKSQKYYEYGILTDAMNRRIETKKIHHKPE